LFADFVRNSLSKKMAQSFIHPQKATNAKTLNKACHFNNLNKRQARAEA
jgi:hypothetical protein